jgi:hypothetical protein
MKFAKLDIGSGDCCRQGDIFQVNVFVTFRKDEFRQALGPLTLEGSHPFAPRLHRRRLSGEVADYHQFSVPHGLKLPRVLLEVVLEGRSLEDPRGAFTYGRRRFSVRREGKGQAPRTMG